MNAPSAHNQQPWRFVIINDRERLSQITDFHPYSQSLKQAPAAILVCCDMKHLKSVDFWEQDCSAATQNILLEIDSKGLGGLWMGVYPKEDYVNNFRKLLDIPDEIMPFSLIAVGHKDEEKKSNDLYEEERVHVNNW